MQPLDLYRAMVTAREIDALEPQLVSRGEAFFHVSGAGHEASACLAPLLTPADWLHCHYRDKALMVARGLPLQEFFNALYCNRASRSQGRQMCAHLSFPELNIISMTTPVGNNSLQSVGVAAEVKERPGEPLVVCSVGDGTTQQGEFLEACGEAARDALPVLFLVQDNRWAISTETTGRTFYSLRGGMPAHLFGIPIQHVDGTDVTATLSEFRKVVRRMRADRQPAIVVMHVERLASHTNADDQRLYRDPEDIRRSARKGDPIARFETQLLEEGIAYEDLLTTRREAATAVAAAEQMAAAEPNPELETSAKRMLPVRLTDPKQERRGTAEGVRLTMKDAIRDVLRHHLGSDEQVTLYGEDIEDPKGDVFGVTKGLSTAFGDRVRNSPLSEATIVGTSIGRAMAGGQPVAFLQFADFLPLAYNQLFSELGTVHWRSGGEWQAPVIVMAACGAYRPGLGPFHAQTFESIAAHTPGIDVFMPSTAEDAAGLLNAAFQSRRPTLFLYPKSCLNDPENTTSADVERQFTPIGTARLVRSGQNITLVGWGNTVRLCSRVAAALERAGIEAEVLDLRCISPWDKQAVIASAEKTAHLVVVHEDNHTCGLGGEIMATVAEEARLPVAMRRVTRPDTYVPCNFVNQTEVLPSFQRVLETAADMLHLDITWTPPAEMEAGVATIEAVGSGPADETVIVTELHVKPGDVIKRGDVVAELEATKSVFELTASASGTLTQILAKEGDTVPVGSVLMKLATGEAAAPVRHRLTPADPGTPALSPRKTSPLRIAARPAGESRTHAVGLGNIVTVSGSRHVANPELANGNGGLTPEEVESRTGITGRQWVGEGETAVSMAVRASRQLLQSEELTINDIDLLICSTTTPQNVTPSTACQVLAGLSEGEPEAMVQAYDINAACSGYLYGLQAGFDYLQTRPTARVLIVTAEVLSPLVDPEDQDTVFLFGDASSATLLYGEAELAKARARIYPFDLCAKVDGKLSLSVPFAGDGYISMNGRRVFAEAVRTMVASLNRVCNREGLSVGDLEIIVPHQANDRITQAIQRRVGVNVYSNIATNGNTSSTSIPLCLKDVLPVLDKGARVGLCAFGGGFTFGAGILEVLKAGELRGVEPTGAAAATPAPSRSNSVSSKRAKRAS